MRKWLINISNQHENILKLLIFSASLILILWMLPHQIRYKFDYTLGKPWSYDDLKAPYDFAIEKNKDSIETEKKLRLTYAPYFIKTDSQSVQLINKRVSELDFFNSRIESKYYDIVLFENIPLLNNFYPFSIRQKLMQHYILIDSFEAPRIVYPGTIEVYSRKEVF